VKRALGTCFGLGELPGAPGTWASIAAAAIWLFFMEMGFPPWITFIITFILVGAASLMSLLCFPSFASEGRDPRRFVMDEVAGMWLALLLVPSLGNPVWTALAALALFRLFDIWKPGLVGMAERLPGAAGVLADDLVAGLAANLILQLLPSVAGIDPETRNVVALATLQGVTEFLPVSSSGHLVVGQALLHCEGAEVWWRAFDCVVHMGTLVAVFIFFARDFADLIKSIPSVLRWLVSAIKAKVAELIRIRSIPSALRWLVSGDRRLDSLSEGGRLLWLVVLVTLPTLFIGLPVDKFLNDRVEQPWFVGLAFILTGCALALFGAAKGTKTIGKTGARDALFVGVIQGIAVLPGISRSGSTLCAAFYRGLSPEAAVRLSFIAATPAIIGATLLRMVKLMKTGLPLKSSELLLGVLISCVVGYASLALLTLLARKGVLRRFAFYLIPLGVAVLIWAAMRG